MLNGRERAGYLLKLCSLLNLSSLFGPYIHMKGGTFSVLIFFEGIGDWHLHPNQQKMCMKKG